MNIIDMLDFVDNLIFNKTGEHLGDLQKSLLEGIWHRKSYQEIAKECYVSKGYIGDIASKLLQFLSSELKEDIKKSNFRSTLERIYINSEFVSISDRNIGYISSQTKNKVYEKQIQDKDFMALKSLNHDLIIAPKINKFYDRKNEILQLYNSILIDNIPLVSVLGLSGIGKSYLVKKFVDLHLNKFELVIWKNIQYLNSLDSLVDNIFSINQINIQGKYDNKLTQLFTLLKEKKCLIILDNLEAIFSVKQFAGICQNQYKGYQNFFQKIIEIEHQSHLILISQEKCQEMNCLDKDLYPIKCLEVSGLKDINIFQDQGLKNQERLLKLLSLYEGNPFYLQIIIKIIKNLYDGSVKDFLDENELIIPKDIGTKLHLLFNKLSSIEKEILISLCHFEEPLSREEFKNNLEMSSTNLINGLESLQNRYLLTKIIDNNTKFKLLPIFREYVINYC